MWHILIAPSSVCQAQFVVSGLKLSLVWTYFKITCHMFDIPRQRVECKDRVPTSMVSVTFSVYSQWHALFNDI